MKLSDASWVLPLVRALANGKTVQVKCEITGRWFDVLYDLSFSGKEETYRIKPDVPEFRLFFYINERLLVSAQRNMPDGKGSASPYSMLAYENHIQNGYGKWLTDWQPIPNL